MIKVTENAKSKALQLMKDDGNEGYFIRVGENGSLDKLKLYRQDGLNTTLLGSSIHTSFGVNPEFRVRVNRDINGNWEVLSDSTGGNNFIYELGVSDNNHTFSTFSGLWCKHTSSNNDIHVQ